VKKLRLAGIADYDEAMRIWTSPTSPTTTGVTRMLRRRPRIITGDGRRRDNWTKSSAWRKNAW
jgi:hypothetical protein